MTKEVNNNADISHLKLKKRKHKQLTHDCNHQSFSEVMSICDSNNNAMMACTQEKLAEMQIEALKRTTNNNNSNLSGIASFISVENATIENVLQDMVPLLKRDNHLFKLFSFHLSQCQ